MSTIIYENLGILQEITGITWSRLGGLPNHNYRDGWDPARHIALANEHQWGRVATRERSMLDKALSTMFELNIFSGGLALAFIRLRMMNGATRVDLVTQTDMRDQQGHSVRYPLWRTSLDQYSPAQFKHRKFQVLTLYDSYNMQILYKRKQFAG